MLPEQMAVTWTGGLIAVNKHDETHCKITVKMTDDKEYRTSTQKRPQETQNKTESAKTA